MINYLIKIFLPSFLLMSCIFSYLFYVEIKSEEILIEATEEVGHINLQIKTIGETFGDLVSDLNYLSTHQLLQKLVSQSPDDAKKYLQLDFLSFSQNKKNYDQIRFIDKKGNEAIRINYNNGKPSIVRQESLSNKGDRYYFKQTMSLDSNEIFISPLDLNMENGQVEIPHKPMIRFATPIYDKTGNKQGILILNYLGSALLNKIRSVATTAIGDVALLNSSGYWFISFSAENEWGFMFEDRKEKVYKTLFPEAWTTITGNESGQFYTEKGLFTFATVHPLQGINKAVSTSFNTTSKKNATLDKGGYIWKTVSRIPPEILNKRTMDLLSAYFQYFILFSLLIFIISLYFANMIFRTKQMHIKVIESRAQAEKSKELFRKSEERLIDAQHIANLGSWELDIKNNQMTWSDGMFKIINIDRNKYEASYETLLNFIHPDDREYVKEKNIESINNKKQYEVDYRLLMTDGEIKYIHHVCKIKINDEGLAFQAFGTIQDITKYKQAEDKITYMAQHDTLTDLSNRRLFAELSNLELNRAKRDKEELALLFIDIDGFKLVNDTLGHAIGDEVLQIIANQLKELVRDSDIISRFGGDEFVILLTNQCHSGGAEKIANAIIKNISSPFKIKNKNISIGASIGIALYPGDADNIEGLIKVADRAMYSAKDSGKNTWKMA